MLFCLDDHEVGHSGDATMDVGDWPRSLAIGELSGSPEAPSAIAEVATLSSVPLSKDPAERRQLMVKFCDLVGSTAMSAGLDPGHARPHPGLRSLGLLRGREC